MELEQEIAALKQDLQRVDAQIASSRDEQTRPEQFQTDKWAKSRIIRLTALKAPDVEKALNQVSEAFYLKAIGDDLLVILDSKPAPLKETQILSEIKALDAAARKEAPESGQKDVPEGRVVRLYYLRDADAIAKAINGDGDDKHPLVKSINKDLLLILAPRFDQVEELKRYIAMLDLPRPQITLQLWSLQMSAPSAEPLSGAKAKGSEIDKEFNGVRQFVAEHDETMMKTLQAGWDTTTRQVHQEIKRRRKEGEEAKKQDFVDYLTADYKQCGRLELYCLGYTDAFADSKPSLSRLLLFLAASQEPLRTAKAVLDAMETGTPTDQDPSDKFNPDTCEDSMKPAQTKGKPKLQTSRLFLPQFRKQLCKLLAPRQLKLFQAAILDFLFQFKWTIQYPHDFIPYDLQRTAQVFDSLLTPLLDAFHHDVETFLNPSENLRKLYPPPQDRVHGIKRLIPQLRARQEAKGLTSRGLIRVTTLSGTEAQVEGRTSNYFDITTPPTLADILKKNEIFKQGLPGLIPEKEAVLGGIAANILSQSQVLAEVGRGTTLKITPFSMDTASSAELRIELEVGEDTAAPPGVVGESSKKDTVDRVTKHKVSDTVRVESLKLFEVSTFSLSVLHPRPDRIFPIVGHAWHAVFGSVPGVGQLFSWPRRPAKVDNRSLAIISAVIVPTAMDLALGMRFEGDRELVAGGTRRFHYAGELPLQVRAFHKKWIACLVNPLENEQICNNLTLSKVLADTR